MLRHALAWHASQVSIESSFLELWSTWTMCIIQDSITATMFCAIFVLLQFKNSILNLNCLVYKYNKRLQGIIRMHLLALHLVIPSSSEMATHTASSRSLRPHCEIGKEKSRLLLWDAHAGSQKLSWARLMTSTNEPETQDLSERLQIIPGTLLTVQCRWSPLGIWCRESDMPPRNKRGKNNDLQSVPAAEARKARNVGEEFISIFKPRLLSTIRGDASINWMSVRLQLVMWLVDARKMPSFKFYGRMSTTCESISFSQSTAIGTVTYYYYAVIGGKRPTCA